MSFLDCSCISHTQVQPMDIEECYEDPSQHFLSCDDSEYTLQGPAGGDDVTGLSTEPSHYQLLSELGRGFNNLSQVNMARHIPTGQLVAVKRTNLDECTEDELLQLMNEVLLSRLFRHSNLLTSRLVFSCCCQLWVLSPLMAYGSADALLRTYFPDGMRESLIAYLLYGALKALEYLHQMGYVHRGVKASHILLYGALKALEYLHQMGYVHRGDLHGYGLKSDIYSLGIVACELVSGRVPFQDMPPTQMLLQKLRGSHCCLLDVAPFPLGELGGLKVSRSGVDSGIGESVATGSLTHSTTAPPADRPQSPAPKNHSATLHNLVQLCLQQQPERRPSASELLSHAFFKQVKRHNRDSFLSLMYPAVPLTNPEEPPVSSPPGPSCHAPLSSADTIEAAWDFSD
uniref:STE20-related kinase adaptor beta n=1 Tax=Nothobranchius korthausae TaxID=1143690 RepID=A0A1A8FEA6_9TELE